LNPVMRPFSTVAFVMPGFTTTAVPPLLPPIMCPFRLSVT